MNEDSSFAQSQTQVSNLLKWITGSRSVSPSGGESRRLRC